MHAAETPQQHFRGDPEGLELLLYLPLRTGTVHRVQHNSLRGSLGLEDSNWGALRGMLRLPQRRDSRCVQRGRRCLLRNPLSGDSTWESPRDNIPPRGNPLSVDNTGESPGDNIPRGDNKWDMPAGSKLRQVAVAWVDSKRGALRGRPRPRQWRDSRHLQGGSRRSLSPQPVGSEPVNCWDTHLSAFASFCVYGFCVYVSPGWHWASLLG
jgi:hypothetical protein